MLSNILFIGLSILLLIGLIYVVYRAIESMDKEYMVANIVSFIFLLVGLIVFAVNTGKNDKLAKSCIKMVLYRIIFSIIFVLLLLTISYGLFAAMKANRRIEEVKVEEKIEIKDKEELDKYINDIKSNKRVQKVEYNITGKIVYINIYFNKDVSVEDAKIIAYNIKIYNLDNTYDYDIYLNIGNEVYIGHYSGSKEDNIIWDN